MRRVTPDNDRAMALSWFAVCLLLVGAAMLFADTGAAGLWISVIAVGIALVVIAVNRNRTVHR